MRRIEGSVFAHLRLARAYLPAQKQGQKEKVKAESISGSVFNDINSDRIIYYLWVLGH
jgi:hypothetical protein